MKHLHLKVIITILMIANAGNTYSQASGSSKSDSLYFESPALFECKLQFPGSDHPDESFPLIICLHGGGGSYATFEKIWRHFENPRFIMATPQAPYKWLLGDRIGYDWAAWPSGNLRQMQKALKLTSIYVENLVKALTEKYNISEVYLLGFSQGSIITQVAGIDNHDLLNGIIILSGPDLNHPGKPEIVWPSKETVWSANHLRVFIAHGRTDKIVDIEFATNSRNEYQKMGYNVSFLEFEGGHEINEKAMREVQKWIIREN